MPEHLIIGTQKAFEKNYAFPYEKKQIGSETIYVCNKGSDWARSNEVLVLRCENGTWTAFDSALNADGLTLQCRQPVFRCPATDITQPGWPCDGHYTARMTFRYITLYNMVYITYVIRYYIVYCI